MSYDISLGQGDSDDIGIVLLDQGIGANLSNYDVFFLLSDKLGASWKIQCNAGASIHITSYNYSLLKPTADKFEIDMSIGEVVNFTKAQGGVTIPLTSTHTSEDGTLFGEFIAVAPGGQQVTFSNDDNYYTVRIKKKLYASG